MRTVLLASLRHNTRRYVASAVAVVIGVAFIVATDGLAGALRSGMTADVAKPFENASHLVAVSDPDEAEKLLAAAEKEGVDASPVAQGWVSARTSSGAAFEPYVGIAPAPTDLQWQVLLDGTRPEQPGEILVSESAAAKHEIGVGDTLTLGGGKHGFEASVVGIAENAGPVGSDVYALWPDLVRTGTVWLDGVLWDGSVGAARAVVGDDAEVMTTAEFIDARQAQITQGVDVIAILVSVFAAIALGVAILVITNTFAILFAQRTRDFALLRCVGVTARQLRRSVRVEALVLGLVAATVGVGAGVVVSFGLAALVGLFHDSFGMPAFRPLWVAGAALVGVLVTIAAAWLPTRQVTRISPLAALRPGGGFTARSRAGALRLVLGLAVIALGVGVLVLAVRDTTPQGGLLLMFAGGGAAFAGVMLLGPYVVPALVRGLGRLATREGAAGSVARLATSNAVRNPRRTATTTASLMVGVTLTTAVLTGLGTISTALSDDTEKQYPLDAAIVAADGVLPETVGQDVAASSLVEESIVLDGVGVTIGGRDVTVLGVPDSTVLRRGADPFAETEMMMSIEAMDSIPAKAMDQWERDGTITLVANGVEHTLRVDRSDAYGPGLLVPAATLADLGGTPQPAAVWARAVDGSDPNDLDALLNRASAGVQVQLGGEYGNRAFIGQQMRIITASVVGLLGIAVIIALIGIANTLGLSVLERTRENSLLRAMGLTRSQLRRTLAVEGLLLAAVATLMGMAIGLAFAWVGVQVLMVGVVEATFSVPVPALVTVAVVAALSGMLASVLPSRKAARVSPASGLALE